jgi:hypothetical protein
MNKIKKFAKSRWHSIPLGAMAIALVAALLVTGTVFAAFTIISNTWDSPTVTVTVNPKPLFISSDLDNGGNLARYTGVEIPLTVSIHNTASVGYSGITTRITIEDSDNTIVPSDVTLKHYWNGDWSVLPLTQNGNTLIFDSPTAPIAAGQTDVTPLRVTFNTIGTYHAHAQSTINP